MLSILDKLLPLAGKLIRVISLRSIIVWTLAILICIIGMSAFEYRDNILKAIFEDTSGQTVSHIPTVPNSIKTHIKNFVDREDLVVGMTILSVDVRNNRRTPVFWYSDDPVLQKQMDGIFSGRFGGIPLFTSDEGNNASIVSAINAQFSCEKYVESGSSILYPGFEVRFPTICNMSIPPYFGMFTGYISFALNKPPSSVEIDLLKAESTNISNEIHSRGILK